MHAKINDSSLTDHRYFIRAFNDVADSRMHLKLCFRSRSLNDFCTIIAYDTDLLYERYSAFVFRVIAQKIAVDSTKKRQLCTYISLRSDNFARHISVFCMSNLLTSNHFFLLFDFIEDTEQRFFFVRKCQIDEPRSSTVILRGIP